MTDNDDNDSNDNNDDNDSNDDNDDTMTDNDDNDGHDDNVGFINSYSKSRQKIVAESCAYRHLKISVTHPLFYSLDAFQYDDMSPISSRKPIIYIHVCY